MSAPGPPDGGVRTAARRFARRVLEPRPGATRRLPVGLASGIRLEAGPELPLEYWLGLYESELAPWLRRFCQPGTRCVDVGGHYAYYALTFAKLAQAPVYCYEPDPDALARSRRNLALNPRLARLIELRSVGVGSRPGPGLVTLDEDVLPAARTRDPAWLLKIDVDGPEVEVLTGAKEFLSRIRPHVIVETHWHGLEDACGSLLVEVGYSPRVVTQRKLFPGDRSWPRGTSTHNRWLVAPGSRTN
jgi:methyltransferase FkbM-like protein